jgi:hypothetical protein
MIERELPGPAAEQHEQHRRPLDVRRPGQWIDENLDHRRHAKQDECRGPRGQPEHEQHRVVSSIVTAMYAVISGGRSGTLYSSVKSAIAVSQFASFVMAEFQNTVATANRSGTASTE